MECKNHLVQFVKKEKSNGGLMVKKQCLNCGESDASAMFKFSDVGGKENVKSLPLFKQDLWDNFCDVMRKEANDEWYRKRNQEREEWFVGYNEYLNSHKWKFKRQLVFKRDNNLCQACLTNKAEEVHHLTYKHVFNEPLFELTSICKRCHDKITELDRE